MNTGPSWFASLPYAVQSWHDMSWLCATSLPTWDPINLLAQESYVLNTLGHLVISLKEQ